MFKVVKENNLYTIQQVYYYPFPQTYCWNFWQPWLMRYDGEITLGSWFHSYQKYIWIDQDLKKASGH